MSFQTAIRLARSAAVVLLAVWIAGTGVVAASHDHDFAEIDIHAADGPRGSTAAAGDCLVCRVFSEKADVQVGPVADHVPDVPPMLQQALATPALRSVARCAIRPRSPPRLLVEA